MQVRIEGEQQKSSVWPRLVMDISRARSQPYNYTLTLNNNGVGPAIISQVDIFYKGEPYKYLLDAIFQMMPDSIQKNPMVNYCSSGGLSSDDVMKAGDSQLLIKLPDNYQLVQWMFNNEDRIFANPDLVFRITYRNVYGDCWMLDKMKVVELGSCE